jgi:hypothetical protein
MTIRLPLAFWFRAIHWLLAEPALTHDQLGEKLGLRRPATVRTVAKKIRAALAAPGTCGLLTALDRLAAQRAPLAEPGVPK